MAVTFSREAGEVYSVTECDSGEVILALISELPTGFLPVYGDR